MAKLDLVAAVRETADRFLTNRHEIWSKLLTRVADELAPLLADIVRQELLHELGQPQPDERLDRVRTAAFAAGEWWAKNGTNGKSWDDWPEEVFAELVTAAQKLPAEMPPQLLLDTEARNRYVQLSDAARVALTTLEGLQRNPLILDVELAYPIERLKKALGEVGHG